MSLGMLLSEKTSWYLFDFSDPLASLKTIALWLTVAVVIAYVVSALCLKGDNRAKILKYFSLGIVCYAAVLGLVLLIWTFVDESIKPLLFVPLFFLIVCVLAYAVVSVFMNNKYINIATLAALAASVVAVIVCLIVYYSTGDPLGENGIEDPSTVKPLALYICAIIAIAAVVATAFFADKRPFKFDTMSLSFAGICIAMSFALSYLRILRMPQGGSITLASLLPLMIYAYMFGPRKGVFAGMIYGLLQAIQDNYIINLPQFLLDYPIAFSCIGLAGLFANVKSLEKYPQVKFLIGAIVAGLARFVMHFFSGAFAFGEFAYGKNVYLYSLTYQAGYVLPDIAIVILVGVIVFSSRTFIKAMTRYMDREEAK